MDAALESKVVADHEASIVADDSKSTTETEIQIMVVTTNHVLMHFKNIPVGVRPSLMSAMGCLLGFGSRAVSA